MKAKLTRTLGLVAAATALATAVVPAASAAKRPVAPPNSGGTACADGYLTCSPTPVAVAV